VNDDVTGRVPQPSNDSDHGHHDALLVARFAAGDAESDELSAAQALVEQCSQCAALADDLRLVASSLHQLPQAPRPRDFQLTQVQADQLKGGFAQRLLRTLAAPRWAVARPLAGAAMTIGIVLAVFGSALSAYTPGATSAPALAQGSSQPAFSSEGGSAPSPAAPVSTAVAAPTAQPGGPRPVSGGPQPPSPASQPENYTDAASAPPSDRSSGGESGFVPASQAPPPAGMTSQPEGTTSPPSAGDKAAQGTSEPQANPIPPTAAGGPPSPSTLVHQALILVGLAIAVLGLALLVLISYARRKFRVETESRP
jgi:hypothetical protein